MSGARQHATDSSLERARAVVGNTNTEHVIQQNEHSNETTTDIKECHSGELNDFRNVIYELGEAMEGRWLGPMPVEDFLNEFLRPADAPLPSLPRNPFGKVPESRFRNVVRNCRYRLFAIAIQKWMPHLRAVPGTLANLQKDSISVYNRVEGIRPPNKTDFSKLELSIVFQARKVAFLDLCPDPEMSFTPNDEDAINARGKLAHHADALHSEQPRNFSFSMVVEGEYARFLRWDPAGTVVTAEFDFRNSPMWMAEFLWRFDHLSASERGHDESAQPASVAPDVDARVRDRLGITDDKIPLYRYTLPGLVGKGYAYGPWLRKPNRSLVRRSTRALRVAWIPELDVGESFDECGADLAVKKQPWLEERVVLIKDTWRYVFDAPGEENIPEHEIYQILYRHDTPSIPEHVLGGDIQYGKTRAREFEHAMWLGVKLTDMMFTFQHYRLVHWIVGRTLYEFRCTKQLVSVVFDALKAHAHAYEHAKILHRDVSPSNIILTDQGKGLLIDWELATRVDENGHGGTQFVGTWQFMSANLLRNPGKIHTLTDGLESFLHVLGWMTLSFVPAVDYYQEDDRGYDLGRFRERSAPLGVEIGGQCMAKILLSKSYPSRLYQPRRPTPLSGLLKALSSPFASLYAGSPSDYMRKRAASPNECCYDGRHSSPISCMRLRVEKYETDMVSLASPALFIETIKQALDNDGGWPTDDEAHKCLPCVLPTRSMYTTSYVLRRNRSPEKLSAKRAASPSSISDPGSDSESSEKRPRVCADT